MVKSNTKPDVVIGNGLRLEFDESVGHYLPVPGKQAPVFPGDLPAIQQDAQFAAVAPLPLSGTNTVRPAPPSTTPAEYGAICAKMVIMLTGAAAALGVVYLVIEFVAIVSRGMVTKFAPALFAGLVDAGYWIGVFSVLGAALFFAISLFRPSTAEQQAEQQTAHSAQTEQPQTRNNVNIFVNQDFSTAQQYVNDFRAK